MKSKNGRKKTYVSSWNPSTGEINDSLTGNFVWSRGNVGEAVSVVMTPFTSSFGLLCFREFDLIPGVSFVGNIGGRIYANRSIEAFIHQAFGKLGGNLKIAAKELAGEPELLVDTLEQSLGMSRGEILVTAIPKLLSLAVKQVLFCGNLKEFVVRNQERCCITNRNILGQTTLADLISLWEKDINPYALKAFHRVIASAVRFGSLVGRLRPTLAEMVGESDAEILLIHPGGDGELLESLGPVVGLSRLAHGRTSADAYMKAWGHRCTFEIDVSAPRPYEEEGWLDKQLTMFQLSKVDAEELLATKCAAYQDAWERLKKRYPHRATGLKNTIEKCAAAGQARELVRSEFIRIIGVVRTLARRIGQLSGIGDDIFFLTVDEALELIPGKPNIAVVRARKLTHEKYKALPPYPPVIQGRFDPFLWAGELPTHYVIVDSDDRKNVKSVIVGVPGSPGQVVGAVRRLDSPDDGYQLVDGEILVTSTVNIGWTLLFPRTKAIVTDVGASLSHAAIVARELGIPAVVNCGFATRLLRTGDNIRVDGTRGMIEILNGRAK